MYLLDSHVLASLIAQWLKTLLIMQEMQQEPQVPSLGWEDSLQKEMATHSSILAWEIPWTEEFVGYSPWGHERVGQGLVTKQHILLSFSPFLFSY